MYLGLRIAELKTQLLLNELARRPLRHEGSQQASLERGSNTAHQ